MKQDSLSQSVHLITRADDCGSSHAANIGIQLALEKGHLKNVSLMAPCSYIEEAASMMADRTDICFGMHATLNAEWDQVKWGPVLPREQVPTLVDEHGMFLQSPELFVNHKPLMSEVMAELQAQLAKLRSLGFPLKYIDTHMVFEYYIPGLEDQLAQWAEEEGLLFYAHYIDFLPSVEPSTDAIGDIVRRLELAPPGQYLFVAHPTVDTPEIRLMGNKDISGERIAERRRIEGLMFTDPRILSAYSRYGIVPIRYDQAVKSNDKLPPLSQWAQL